jgi:hypothetical protein
MLYIKLQSIILVWNYLCIKKIIFIPKKCLNNLLVKTDLLFFIMQKGDFNYGKGYCL